MAQLQPRLYGQILGMLRRLAHDNGDAIVVNDDGVACLVNLVPYLESTGRIGAARVDYTEGPTTFRYDIEPILDGNGVVHPDPVYVVNTFARDLFDTSRGQDEQEPGLRFVVAGDYTESETIDGRDWWATFDEAVAAARSTQVPISHNVFEVSRACVDLRMSATYAPPGTSSGIDTILARWEVFPDRVVITGTEYSLAPHQVADVMALDAPKVGFA